MQQKFIVLGIEQESKYEKGEIVEKLWVHYFKPDLSDTRLFKGFNITKIDVRGVLSVDDFEQSTGFIPLNTPSSNRNLLLKQFP